MSFNNNNNNDTRATIFVHIVGDDGIYMYRKWRKHLSIS